ncbi:MAG: dihydrodipicolinate synthase family protein [Burkholderiaceae bacterium]
MHDFWCGVLPAITTPFLGDGGVDHAFLARHVDLMLQAGCTGIVPLGSLGETATLGMDEKRAVLATVVAAVAGRAAVVPGVAALATADAVQFARAAHALGCSGLMVLPPYVYSTDWREMRAHVSAVIGATPLPCMLYNNPVAYKTDFSAEQMRDLAQQHANFVAVKESSADVRRIAAIRALMGDRLRILLGVDDLIVEGLAAGACGWIAGLVNAFPQESVRLFELARAGRSAEVDALYHWFLPLLRLDVVPKFVQLIKLVQSRVDLGSSRVRAPRLELTGQELADANAIIDQALAKRPRLPAAREGTATAGAH